MFSSNPGGKSGPESKEERGDGILALERGPKLLAIGMRGMVVDFFGETKIDFFGLKDGFFCFGLFLGEFLIGLLGMVGGFTMCWENFFGVG